MTSNPPGVWATATNDQRPDKITADIRGALRGPFEGFLSASQDRRPGLYRAHIGYALPRMNRSPLIARLANHSLFRVGLFTAAYMLFSVWGAIRVGNREFVFYIAVMAILIAGVGVVHARVRLSPALLWLLSIWGALHMAGGLVNVPENWPTDGEFRVLYSWWIIPREFAEVGEPGGWLKYDQVVHAYGFGVATWLCWQGLCGALMRDGTGPGAENPRLRPTPGLMVLVAAAGMGLGALNEIVEFIATRITVTNVGGYVNTGWDLVYNAIGAIIAASAIYLVLGTSSSADAKSKFPAATK